MDRETSPRPNLKRKRHEPPQVDLSVKIGGKLHHELKEVRQASKKAKAFETQKLVKRLKELRLKDGDASLIQDHGTQLTSLKAIDHDLVGNTALKTKILKDHTLRHSDVVQAALAEELQSNLITPAPLGTPFAKVQSRLFSSKILAAQVTTSVGNIRRLLNPELPRLGKEAGASQQESRKPATKAGESLAVQEDTILELDKDKDEDEAEDGGKDDTDNEGWESGTVDENESGAAEDWESGSVENSIASDPGSNDYLSEENSEVDQPVAPPKKTARVVSSAKSATSALQSTFLPSLSVGFIRGSDDSDLSEGEDKAPDPRKNRRGQRARQAIWEKKYGRNANHKKKETAEAMKGRNKNSTSRPGANTRFTLHSHTPKNNGDDHRSFSKPKAFSLQRQESDAGWAQRHSGATSRIPTSQAAPRTFSRPQGKTASNALHPSWEAKRKLKESQSESIVPSLGNKIKF